MAPHSLPVCHPPNGEPAFCLVRFRFLFGWILTCLFLLAAAAPPAHAQGCAQCLDSTRATPPQVQAAYRHAILLLGGVGSTLFLTTLFLVRKYRWL